jgi:hypothetical protein
MILYRADKRDFNVGDEIKTAGHFTTKNPQGSENIERIFESKRPNTKPLRSECLYLFEDIDVAKKHWSKMTGGKLYKIEIDDSLILHRADMQFIDLAFSKEDEVEMDEIAINYWCGKETEKPQIEVLVLKAFVSGVISKVEDERIKYFKSWALA